MTEVRFASHELVQNERSRWIWVDLKHFAIDPSATDRQLLEATMGAPQYRHDYASPFTPERLRETQGMHASWPVANLNVTMFRPVDADSAQEAIVSWANDDWTDGYQPADEETMRHLREHVFIHLRPGALYELHPSEGEEAMHDDGWVVGFTGFHEFVVIDRDSSSLHLIVASDD